VLTLLLWSSCIDSSRARFWRRRQSMARIYIFRTTEIWTGGCRCGCRWCAQPSSLAGSCSSRSHLAGKIERVWAGVPITDCSQAGRQRSTRPSESYHRSLSCQRRPGPSSCEARDAGDDRLSKRRAHDELAQFLRPEGPRQDPRPSLPTHAKRRFCLVRSILRQQVSPCIQAYLYHR
jgi:hypothetical protein